MLLGLLLFYLKKFFPLRYSPEEMAVPITGLHRKYRKHVWLAMILFVVLMPGCVYLCLLGMQAGVDARLPDIAGPVDAIRVGTGILLVVSFFPGIALACGLIAILQRLVLGRQGAREFRMLSNRQARVDATRLYIALGIFMVAGSCVMALFAFRTALYLGRDELVVNRMWSWHEERYPYAQIKALREQWDADNGKWDFVLQLDGAPDWNTGHEVVFPDDAQKAFLARRTGKAIMKVP